MWRFARNELHHFAGLSHLLRRFYESIRDDAEPPIAYRDILRVSLMIHETIRQLGGAMKGRGDRIERLPGIGTGGSPRLRGEGRGAMPGSRG